jgi:catechol 2,3-dioxygenase-like lactoylglutathione lyase family enzyme
MNIQWQGIHHIALVTPDLNGTVQFYQEVLGMKPEKIYPETKFRGRHCFITLGEENNFGIHFFEHKDATIFQSSEAIKELAANPNSKVINSFLPGAFQHFALALNTEEEALSIKTKLEEHGIPMTPIYNLDTIKDFIFIDNNGIQVEVAWPKVQD